MFFYFKKDEIYFQLRFVLLHEVARGVPTARYYIANAFGYQRNVPTEQKHLILASEIFAILIMQKAYVAPAGAWLLLYY